MKLDGFGIFVKDMAVMIRFYKDVLGFEIREDEDTTNVYLQKELTPRVTPDRGRWDRRFWR